MPLIPLQYDEEYLIECPHFEQRLLAKLEVDGSVMGGLRERLCYAVDRLTGKTAPRISPWVVAYKNNSDQVTLENFK
jgi:hypothetical protein